jgi:hypothetical protein
MFINFLKKIGLMFYLKLLEQIKYLDRLIGKAELLKRKSQT